jgi:hypothetical protein
MSSFGHADVIDTVLAVHPPTEPDCHPDPEIDVFVSFGNW